MGSHFPRKKPSRALVALCLFLLLAVGVLTALFLPFFSKLGDPDFQLQVEEWISSIGMVGWLILLILQILQVIIAFIPGGPVEVIAGVLFGVWGGTLVCLLGSIIASALIFFTVRRVGASFVERLFGKEQVLRFDFFHDNRRMETITFLLFLIPGLPKDMLTYLAGISQIRASRFLVISTLGRFPAVVTTATMGATMSEGNWIATLLIFLLTAAVGLVSIRYKDRFLDHMHHRHLKGQGHSSPNGKG